MKKLKTDQQKIQILNRLVAYYGFQKWWQEENPLADWLSMILIQQTTEKNAKQALANLQPYLTLTAIQQLELEELQQLIRPAGFYQGKSRAIKALVRWFADRGGELAIFLQWPTDQLRKELLEIPGIGPETADVMLLYIFKRPMFIADQYAIRLFERLGYGPYKNYASMQKEFAPLAQKVPYELCREWHAAIDVHGKAYRANKQLAEEWLLEPANF
ncbi:endonuclease III domain-containing protein [Enterococcus sp. AZ109]|uniref:endonuclease III domain-containing protein n=1 Tax=Enterococcus sp. AZ109 TaxID=2774634 RepID=UPI003F683785